jgi:hypothetical protein
MSTDFLFEQFVFLGGGGLNNRGECAGIRLVILTAALNDKP